MNYYYSFTDGNGDTLITVIVSEVRRFSLNWSRHYIIYTLLNDSIGFYSDGRRMEMSAGDLIMINPNTPFSTLSDERGRCCLAVTLSPKIFRAYRDDEHSLLFDIRTTEQTRGELRFCTLRAILSRLMLYGTGGSKSDLARFEGYMHLLVGQLISEFSHSTLPKLKSNPEMNGLFTFETMATYIKKNFSGNITLEDVARVGNYNPNYVSQFFKLKAGVNFYEFLTRIRLRHAITYINNSDLSLTEIAASSGFPSSKALTRCFVQFYGMSPSDYRARIRSGEFAQLRAPATFNPDRFNSTLAQPFSQNVALLRSKHINGLLVAMANSSSFHADFPDVQSE